MLERSTGVNIFRDICYRIFLIIFFFVLFRIKISSDCFFKFHIEKITPVSCKLYRKLTPFKRGVKQPKI